MIANKYFINTGVGVSQINRLPGFDKALLKAGVGNYNLVRLSSILPAHCIRVEDIDLPNGSLLPTAYSTITSDVVSETIVSAIGVGLPADEDKVGVIMEYSYKGFSACENIAANILDNMIEEAFKIRGWELRKIEKMVTSYTVKDGEIATTFACIAEW